MSIDENRKKKSSIVSDGTDRLLSMAEAAERLHTAPDTWKKIIRNGNIQLIRFGRRSYIRKKVFEDFLESMDGKDLDLLTKQA